MSMVQVDLSEVNIYSWFAAVEFQLFHKKKKQKQNNIKIRLMVELLLQRVNLKSSLFS